MPRFKIRADDNDYWEHSYFEKEFPSLEEAKKWCHENGGGTCGYTYSVECEVKPREKTK